MKKYTYSVMRTIETQVPDDILGALSRNGWNVFGIYELVRRELDSERRLTPAAPDQAGSGSNSEGDSQNPLGG
jgi:hypothetical protein